MTTPIEERITALETWRGATDTLLGSMNERTTALEARSLSQGELLAQQEQRLRTLEAAYQDAVKRFQKAERMTGRLRVILRILWGSTAGDRAGYLSRLPEDERRQAAIDLEEVDATEKIGRREDPDEWRERVFDAPRG